MVFNSYFLDALACRNRGPVPIWLMRQAGRYLPEYRQLKKNRSLFELFHDPETIVEATLQPIRRFSLDAAIVFADILTLFDGLSIRYDFPEAIGPRLLDPPTALLERDGPESYAPLLTAIGTLKQQLSIPLIGFAAAPFTIASYLIEGQASREGKATKQWLYRDPEGFMALLERLTQATLKYLHLQIDAGVDAIQLFDSQAAILPLSVFRRVCLPHLHLLVKEIKKRVPIILFAKGSFLFAQDLATSDPTALSLDWSGSLPEFRRCLPAQLALQGNLDPMLLYGSRKEIATQLTALLEAMAGDPGYIFNLGHGVLADTPIENVAFLVEYIREYRTAAAS